ncbi:MAG: hypothetical protein ACLSW1_06835 [Lachnospira sp.]
MAKKKLLKAAIGVGAAAVAGKVAYDKYKVVKASFDKEEKDSAYDEVKKYNAIFANKLVEVKDEEFTGCEVKSICANTVIDLSFATFEKDTYLNFSSTLSSVKIILPEGVNVSYDIDSNFSKIKNYVDITNEEGIHTVYIIGKSVVSNIEILPMNFYIDDDMQEDDFEDFDECEDCE